jgi:phosphoglucosamine mutase
VTTRKYFGTDGIRDRAGEGLLAPDRVLAYGRALGRFVAMRRPGGRVLLGRDTRASGPEISAALAEGLVAAGLVAVDGGVLTTPAVQTLCREEGFALALVISASHNPAHDNGVKVFGGDGRKLPDAEEAAVELLIDADRGRVAPAPGGKLVADADAADRYVRFVREACLPGLDLGGMRIVLDCAHGAASRLGPRLLDAFGARVTVRHAEPDGLNINREAGVFYVDRLRSEVREGGPAIGLALDGDADRAMFLDEEGTLRDGDAVVGLLAADLAARGALPGNRVVVTVMSNFGLHVFLKKRGVTAEQTAVGDRYVAQRMDETGAVLGGEQSGHVILRDGARWYGDGLLTALRVCEALRRTGRSMADSCREIERFPQLLVNVRVKAKPPTTEIPGLHEAAAAAENALGGEGRVLLRYSGTEPLLRVMVEGREEARVRALAEGLADVVRRSLGA